MQGWVNVLRMLGGLVGMSETPQRFQTGLLVSVGRPVHLLWHCAHQPLCREKLARQTWISRAGGVGAFAHDTPTLSQLWLCGPGSGHLAGGWCKVAWAR